MFCFRNISAYLTPPDDSSVSVAKGDEIYNYFLKLLSYNTTRVHNDTSYTLQSTLLPTVETDFIGNVITVTLPHPGGGSSGEVEVEIPIIDDMIVEVWELFLGYIEIVNAVDIGTIVLGRNTTRLGIDNCDGKQDVKLTYIHSINGSSSTYPT